MHGRRLERVWRALADPTRRRLIDLLSRGPATTGQLTSAIPRLSRFAVMKHLRVLEGSGLLLPRKEGRQVWNHLNAVPLREAYERWVGRDESAAAAALLGLKRHVESAGEHTWHQSPVTIPPPVAEQEPLAPPPHAQIESLSLELPADAASVWHRLAEPQEAQQWGGAIEISDSPVWSEGSCWIRVSRWIALEARILVKEPRRRLVAKATTPDGSAIQVELALVAHPDSTAGTLTVARWGRGWDSAAAPPPLDTRFMLDSLWRLRDALAPPPPQSEP